MRSPCLFFSQFGIMRSTIVRIGTLTIVVTTAVEVTFFGTNHYIKIMGAYFLNVLSISISCDTIFISLRYTIPTKVIVRIRILGDYIVLLTFSILSAIAGM